MSTPLPPQPSGPGADKHGSAMNASAAPAVPGQGSEVDPLTVFDPAKLEADLRSMTRIVLRPIGSPLPLGFAFLGRDSIAATLMMTFASTWLIDALIFYVNPYTAFALLMEDSRGREVLPIGRLGMARQATHGTLAIQLRDIERQAGVRRTL